MVKSKILIVDDEKNMRWALKKAFGEKYEVAEAGNGLDALKQIKSSSPDIILLDIKMPKMNGIELLKEIKQMEIPTVMLTAYGEVDSAIEALNLGASDYITKPFDIHELTLKVKEILHNREKSTENVFENLPIIGRSQKIHEVLQMVQRVANTTATILISGESGTGKELIARAIHQLSKRHDKPYISVNCGAIPEELLESELFGHEKGAFTGAISRKQGRFERAHKGTLFLDEIGEMSLAMQVKLLRVLQEKEIERVGGNEIIKVDVRVIAATNRELHKMVETGTFREDLYYRLKVVPIQLPPLRERKEDILELVNYFIEKYANRFEKKANKISDIALQLLLRHSWHGNIRELENMIERAVVLCTGETITPEVLPREIFEGISDQKQERFKLPEEGIQLEEVEKDLILQALQRVEYNQTKAAKLLGISRQTLIYRMNKYQIQN